MRNTTFLFQRDTMKTMQKVMQESSTKQLRVKLSGVALHDRFN